MGIAQVLDCFEEHSTIAALRLRVFASPDKRGVGVIGNFECNINIILILIRFVIENPWENRRKL
jgi:hypothetical protein